MRVVRALGIAALLSVGATAVAPAQQRAPIEVAVPRQGSSDGAYMTLAPLLATGQVRDLLQAGFPARLHFRAELWREGGWFDDLENSAEWDVIVQYEPRLRRYRVLRIDGARPEFLGGFPSLAEASGIIERPHRLPLVPARAGRRYYYNVILDLEMVSLSDLDQLERWLEGELRPAVRGRTNAAGALGRGARTLFLRVIGGEQRRYERRSSSFRA